MFRIFYYNRLDDIAVSFFAVNSKTGCLENAYNNQGQVNVTPGITVSVFHKARKRLFICRNCADRYVTDYVKSAGHDYEKTIAKAEEGKVGYTKYTCKTCDYNYVSDFVTSGDGGYLDENPDTPEQPDNPDKPENPDTPENPDKPGEHTREYVFDAVVRENEKTMTVSYLCECGDTEPNS